MVQRRLRIGVVTALRRDDRESASGTVWSMVEALQRHAGDIVYLGPSAPPERYPAAVFDRVGRILTHKRYVVEHSPLVSRGHARHFRRAIDRTSLDLIFAPLAASEIACLETELPMVYASDATAALLVGLYPEWRSLLGLSQRQVDRIERLAIGRADAALYPSEWAARSAVEDYGADPRLVHVLPYGPNLRTIIVAPDRTPSRGDCRLLFLGVAWERKGGPIALETLRELRARGVNATLTVCGCEPTEDADLPGLVLVPRLRKNQPGDDEALEELLASSHFLVAPTRADAFGIAFCEASAYGLPSLAADIGGVRGAIEDGKNGYLLSAEATGRDYADLIEQLVDDPARYRTLARSSRRAFETRLNWDAWGRDVAAIIDGVLAAHGGPVTR
jgi:glycosyltransferase involved in cell wall biosynthesis